MSQRYTVADVQEMFTRAREAAQSVGIPGTAQWELHTGDPTNGHAWRMFRRGELDGTGTGLADPIPNMDRGYIGWTKREAYNTLHTLARAWEAVGSFYT